MMEPEEVKRFERHVRAIAAAADDPEGLAQALQLQEQLAAAIEVRVVHLREVDGFSWADLARPLGITRQALAQRFTKSARTAHAAAQRRFADARKGQ
jgi:hypothetical protein